MKRENIHNIIRHAAQRSIRGRTDANRLVMLVKIGEDLSVGFDVRVRGRRALFVEVHNATVFRVVNAGNVMLEQMKAK